VRTVESNFVSQILWCIFLVRFDHR